MVGAILSDRAAVSSEGIKVDTGAVSGLNMIAARLSRMSRRMLKLPWRGYRNLFLPACLPRRYAQPGLSPQPLPADAPCREVATKPHPSFN